MAGFLSRTRSVGTGYEFYAHGIPAKSRIITFVVRKSTVCLFPFVIFFILSPNRSWKSFLLLNCNAVVIGNCYGFKLFCYRDKMVL